MFGFLQKIGDLNVWIFTKIGDLNVWIFTKNNDLNVWIFPYLICKYYICRKLCK